jgi:hypothetical protein
MIDEIIANEKEIEAAGYRPIFRWEKHTTELMARAITYTYSQGYSVLAVPVDFPIVYKTDDD